jgi:hypothetical protein
MITKFARVAALGIAILACPVAYAGDIIAIDNLSAVASPRHHQEFPVWAIIFLCVIVGLPALTITLFWAANTAVPLNYKWRTRLRIAGLLLHLPLMVLDDNPNDPNASIIRDRTRNLFAVWRRRHVGTAIIALNLDGSISHTGVANTWWDFDIIGALMPPWTGRINVSELIRQGGQIQRQDGGWFFTLERWVAIQPELHAFCEAQRANLTKEVNDALEILGLTTAATVSDITDARNRLLKTSHPDHGGSTAKAQSINAAHDLLRSVMFGKTA